MLNISRITGAGIIRTTLASRVRNYDISRCSLKLVRARSFSDEANEKSCCYISGFNAFVNRKDLHAVLGKHKPLIIDPLLDANNYATGIYHLSFQHESEIDELSDHVTQLNEDEKFHPKLSVFRDGDNLYKLSSSLAKNVTNRTVRVRLAVKTTNKDGLRTFFSKFDLSDEEIFSVQRAYMSHFLVQFSSPEEAERAVAEKNLLPISGREVQLFWYQA